jgi:PAS domain S-box-containing protein
MHRRDRDKVSRLPETVMLCVSLLVVLAIAALSYQSGNQAQAADQQLKISRATLDLCQDLLSTLKDAETGQRGFLLTGKEHYLEPYSQALTAIPEMLRKLHIQALQRPDQTQRLKALDGLISAKLAELKDTIELRRSGRAEEALAIVDGGNGKALMDEIRDRSAIMDKVAEDRLSQFSAEAGRSTARLRWVSTSGSALLLVFLCLAALTTFRGMTRREQLYSQAYASQKLLGTTLSSIADGVITTDPAGNITFLNPVAEKLTGWATAEASGVHITSVFVIVNETSGLPVENPLQRALQEGTAVGLANHTSLIVKNGEQRSIDDTAAPIRDEDGNIVGAVLVFRDISAKRVEQPTRLRI